MNRFAKISEKEYLGKYGLSHDFLMNLDKESPANPVLLEGIRTDHLFYKYILKQDEFNASHVTAPAYIASDKRTASFKEFAAKQVKPIVFQNQITELNKMKNNLIEFQFEGRSLKEYFNGAYSNLYLFWETIVNFKKVQCKGQVDILKLTDDSAIIFDLNVVRNCCDFEPIAESNRVYRKAAYHIAGLKKIRTKLKKIRFVMITIEEHFPYGVKCYELDDCYLTDGIHENHKLLDTSVQYSLERFFVYDNKVSILERFRGKKSA
ncbi:MAG: hypothetical protein A2015_03670 [Spirochaetes bacterium GWF1_31_7]|nr:MAG: hypothetical protein A2Y29_04900 [Spirochaetes bacterium GWE2_31_10]OHD53234.1 MAG: hypothetical protein A2015_03670 [Spirochaetes bacterium GWF1_31_7]OHD83112.1 MAG: hypothetical protein A2355_11495 [Spirochaetes bacterium RIFOXYB1_FULL_32_8]HBD94735.1 hypothetical protein [Spirochaetia bacterium]HBI39063.1 hypothetical protein [Spirochaetia bacterium]